MDSFTLYNPVKLVFGENKIETVAKYIPKGSTVLLTYGGGSIKKNGIYDMVLSALSDYRVLQFGGIEPNPRYETLIQAVELARVEKVSFILAVGGGSVIDGTKFISGAIPYQGKPWDIITSSGTCIKESIPFETVLTIPATGSEMNSGAVITRAETSEKLSFYSPLCFPQFSILDPMVVRSLPKRQIANGVVDAFVHVLEQYLVSSDTSNPIQDGFSESILKTLISEGTKVYQDVEDTEAVKHFMFAATMALNGLIGVGVRQDWSTHRIGHELTALYGIDHARTLAIILPGVWQVMFEDKKSKLAKYAQNVWHLQGSETELATEAIRKTETFFHTFGIDTHLSDYTQDIAKADIIPERIKNRGWKLGERQNIDSLKVEEILRLRV